MQRSALSAREIELTKETTGRSGLIMNARRCDAVLFGLLTALLDSWTYGPKEPEIRAPLGAGVSGTWR
jgi:hypothetical protein